MYEEDTRPRLGSAKPWYVRCFSHFVLRTAATLLVTFAGIFAIVPPSQEWPRQPVLRQLSKSNSRELHPLAHYYGFDPNGPLHLSVEQFLYSRLTSEFVFVPIASVTLVSIGIYLWRHGR